MYAVDEPLMNKVEPRQTCPFCQADWGNCEHYRVLSEWEKTAEKAERAARSSSFSVDYAEEPGRRDIRIDPLV